MASPAARTSLPNARDLSGRRLGRYEVLTLLASGGMATVYIARAQGVAGFERLVAIKVLHPHLAHDEEFISMFLDEARLAARIRHPNVVGTLDISDTQGDGYFLVMEYVEGDHFGALLRNAGKAGEKLPVPVVARIVMDALAGLSAAHHLTDSTGEALDIVHRDVSPHNILVDAEGVARITDFGVAKAQVRLSSTRDGQFKGKLSYMAPEQAASGWADQRSDLFSMGIVLWEALTGRRLFRGENNADVLNKILNPEVPPPSTFDESITAFDPVLEKALAREVEDRYQSADEFLEAVEEAAAKSGGVAQPRAVAREVKRWLAEKIENERRTVRDSMEALGRSDVQPGVLPRPEAGNSGSQSSVRPIGADDATMGAKPSTITGAVEAPPSRTWMALAAVGLIALVLAGGIIAWLALGPEDEAPVAREPAPEPAEPIAAPPEVPPPQPEPVVAEPETPPVAEQPAQTPEQTAEQPERRRVRRVRRETGDGDDEPSANPYRR